MASADLDETLTRAAELASYGFLDNDEADEAQDLLSILRREVERLHADLEVTEPAEEPTRSLLLGSICCECCGARIPAGDLVAVFDDGDAVAHWGPCPEPDLWRVEYDVPSQFSGVIRVRPCDPEAGMTILWMRPYEEALVVARRVAQDGDVSNVRLYRVKAGRNCTTIVERSVPDGVECTYRKEPCGRAVVSGDRCERHQESDRG